MNYKIAQLILTPKQKAGAISEIYISQPDANKERLAGKLFVMVEMVDADINGLKIVNFLIDNVNQTYYQNEKIILRERIPSLRVEHIFEVSLSKTNKRFNEFLRSERIIFNRKKINISVGVLHEETLYFANTGNNRIFLIYPQKDADNGKINYKISDIGAKTNDENSEKSTNKLFTNIINGPIPTGGFFLFSNEALPEYLPEKQLLEIITTLPPAGAVEQIKNNLGKINSYISFLAIIIKNSNQNQKKQKPSPKSKPSTQSSILDLNRTEDHTEDLLTPSGVIGFKKWIKRVTGNMKNSEQTVSPASENSIILKDKIIVKRHSLIRSAKKTLGRLVLSLLGVLSQLRQIFNKKKDKDLLLQDSDKIKEEYPLKTKNIFSHFSNIKTKHKILIIIIFASVIFFSFNTFHQNNENKAKEEQQNYNELAKQIELKQDHVDANLLYSNENSARKLLNEINGLLEKLPQETNDEKEKYSAFREKFLAQMEKVQRVTKISDLQLLNDVSELNSHANADNIILPPESGRIYVADSSQKSIYIIKTNEKSATTITDMEEKIALLNSPVATDKNTIFYLNKNGVILFSGDKLEFETTAIDFVGKNPTALGVYNGRLYVSTKQGSILRYNRSGTAFSSPYKWLPEASYMKDPVDMSIDGHIYVLLKSGKVIKLLRGERQDFNLENVEPPLTEAGTIFVSPEQKFIYILDKGQNRLLLYDKSGQFILQYEYPQLSNINDFAVNESKQKIYLLANNKIYSFLAPHFKQ